MEAELIQYLPEWFREIQDFHSLAESETGELTVLAAALEAVHRNFYLSAADAGTVYDWERLLHITPNVSVEDLSFRRARIINRLSSSPPFSMRFLYDRLDLLIGKGRWSVVVDYPGYTLYVEASAENQSWAGEVLATINTIKPCHIAYISRPLVPAALGLSERVGLTELELRYRMGYWGLGKNPFGDFVDKGVIVTPEQKTLTDRMREQVASFLAENVTAVRLNNTVVITDFELKSGAGNLATIEYSVTAEQAKIVTQLELLNAEGDVLERAPVYIPVEGSVQITHRIPVKEVG